MENELKFFFDSYALIEIYKGSENYEKYKKAKIVTAYIHVYETYYNLRKECSSEEIEDFFQQLQKFCISLKFDWIKDATEFRLRNKKADLSYADCLGYIVAKELKIKFLTGDRQFEKLDNVEFTKKS